jgi:hypothetical protein
MGTTKPPAAAPTDDDIAVTMRIARALATAALAAVPSVPDDSPEPFDLPRVLSALTMAIGMIVDDHVRPSYYDACVAEVSGGLRAFLDMPADDDEEVIADVTVVASRDPARPTRIELPTPVGGEELAVELNGDPAVTLELVSGARTVYRGPAGVPGGRPIHLRAIRTGRTTVEWQRVDV